MGKVLATTRQLGLDESLTYELHYVTEPADVPAMVAWCQTQSVLLLDIETDGKSKDGLDWRSKKIATLQVGNPKAGRAYVVCVRSVGAALEPLIAEIASPRALKLGQNIRFELQFICWKYGVHIRNVADCQLMELVLRAGLFPINKTGASAGEPGRKAYTETSMARLMLRYRQHVIEKGEHVRLGFWATPPGQLTREQLEYAAGDVIDPYYIAVEQHKEVKARRLTEIVKLEFELLPLLVETELHGIDIDAAAWMDLWQEAVSRRALAKQVLDDYFRPGSQQAEFFQELAYPVDDKPRPKRESLAELTARRAAPSKRETGLVRPNDGKQELNYDSPQQMREALARYCKSINWPVEVVVTPKRLRALKQHWGRHWLQKNPAKTVEDVPDWYLPEAQYVVLVNLEGPALRLAKLRQQLPRDLVATYLEYKEASKLAGTYGMKFLNEHGVSGRVHVYFHQAITSTGRLSSEPNLQNLPRDDTRYRACFKPRPGNVFIIRDYASIEPRLSAETSQDPNYVKTFLDKADIYCRVGEAMTGKPIDKKRDKALRQGFKSVVLGTAYNMGARKLRDDLTLKLEQFIEAGEATCPTFDEALELRRRFFETHPGIKRYQDQCIGFATPNDEDAPEDTVRRPKLWDKYLSEQSSDPAAALVTYVEGPCGRKRWFRPDAKNTYTEAPNAPIQGCSATITKLAAVLIQRYADAKGYFCVFANLVHDELIVEVNEQHAAEMTLVVRDQMVAAGERYIKSVPVLAEAPTGDGIYHEWFKEAA